MTSAKCRKLIDFWGPGAQLSVNSSFSSVLVNCVLDVIGLDVIPE